MIVKFDILYVLVQEDEDYFEVFSSQKMDKTIMRFLILPYYSKISFLKGNSKKSLVFLQQLRVLNNLSHSIAQNRPDDPIIHNFKHPQHRIDFWREPYLFLQLIHVLSAHFDPSFPRIVQIQLTLKRSLKLSHCLATLMIVRIVVTHLNKHDIFFVVC